MINEKSHFDLSRKDKIIMKKKKIYIGLLIIIVIIVFVFLISQLIHPTPTETNMTPSEMASSIVESQSGINHLLSLTKNDEEFNSYVSNYYMIDVHQIKEGIILYADGIDANEIAVFVFKDKKDINQTKEKFMKYIENRAKVFEGYAPLQAAMIKKGEVVVNGNYLALLICEDPSQAKETFFDCFQSDHQESTTHFNKTISEYDSRAILHAWKSKDTSALTKTDLEILNKASDVIKEKVTDNMSDYEKELAIHDFITSWSSFDYSVFSHSTDNIKEGSDTPYGVLINREAMCHGYSSTFQLFMDMLEIESIIVYGHPNSEGVEHSWNMVKLDGEWYCVDVAWDDPIGGSPTHTYFNVTSQYLRKSGIHHWDESQVPQATATKYSYTYVN